MHRTIVSVVVALSACSSSGEYTCPDPVGRIIRDDCESYRVRYDSLRAELGASFGPLQGRAALGQEKLRDPSELIQLLSQRTYALCRDFNACRVPPEEYRARREATDRVFSSVATISEQLNSDLDAQSKQRLVEALVQALRGDTVRAAPGSARLARTGRARYLPWIPWYDAAILPPQPRSAAGFPQLSWVSADVGLSWYRESETRRLSDGYRPKLVLALRGEVHPDDVVQVDWGGRTSERPVASGGSNGLVVHHAEAPEDIRLKAGSFTATVIYLRGADGKRAIIGRRTFPVLSSTDEDHRAKSTHYGLDRDPDARQGRLVFRPHQGLLPSDFDRPHLSVVLRLRRYRRATARCWVDGKLLGPAMSSSGGQEGTFQDRARYRRISPSRSETVAHPFIEWWRHDFALPLALPRGSAPLPQGLERWPRSGAWRCLVAVEGEPVRELTFRVQGDGRLSPHPAQLEHARPEWLVETRVLASSVEDPLGSAAGSKPDAAPSPEAASPSSPLRLSMRIGARRGSLAAGQLEQALRAARPGLETCIEEPGRHLLKVHVYPSGEVGFNKDESTDSWVSACFGRALKAARFGKADDYTYFDLNLGGAGHPAREQRGPVSVFGLRGPLRGAEVLDGVASALPKLRECAAKNRASYRLRVAIGSDGRLEIQDWARGYHPAVTYCLQSALKGLRFRAAEPYTTLGLELSLGQ